MARLPMSLLVVLTISCGHGSGLFAETAFKDRLKRGESIGVFYVTKVAGANDDGVEPGEDLCYRCRYGSSPLVMVFTRADSAQVAEMAKRIDAAIGEFAEERLKGLITLMGDDLVQLKHKAEKIAARASITRVPVVVAKENITGPLNYRIPTDAEVTVVVAKDSQVVHTYVFDADRIDIRAVMSKVREML